MWPQKPKTKKVQQLKKQESSSSGSEDSDDMGLDLFGTPTTPKDVKYTFGAPVEQARETLSILKFELEKYVEKDFHSDFEIDSIKAHKIILSQCTKLDLSGSSTTTKGIERSTLLTILNYLYSAEIKIDGHNYLILMKAGDILGLDSLVNGCFEYIVKTQCTVENVCKLLMDAKGGQYGSLKIENLVEKSQAFVSREAEGVFKSKEFLNLDEELVCKFSASNTLQIDEMDLYNALVKWAQHRSKNEDVNQILSRLLKNVRFALMEPEILIKTIKPSGFVTQERILESLEFIIAPEEFASEKLVEFTPRSGAGTKFTWDIVSGGSTGAFTLADNNTKVTKSKGLSAWNDAMVYGTKKLTSGKTYFEIKINHVNNDKYGFAVGLAKSNNTKVQYTSDMVIGLSGYAYNLSGTNTQKVNTNDRIGILVDFSKGKCFFFHNDKEMFCHGVLSKGVEYWPVVHLYYPSDSCSLSFPTKIPKTK